MFVNLIEKTEKEVEVLETILKEKNNKLKELKYEYEEHQKLIATQTEKTN